MKDRDKTKEQLVSELAELRQRVAMLEALEAEFKRTGEGQRKALAAQGDALIKTLPVGIFRTDVQGNYVYVNERWCEITGLTPEEAYGEGWV